MARRWDFLWSLESGTAENENERKQLGQQQAGADEEQNTVRVWST